MVDHMTSIDRVDDWWMASCDCGWGAGPYPGADDACHAAGDHRVRRAIADERTRCVEIVMQSDVEDAHLAAVSDLRVAIVDAIREGT